MYRVIVTLLVRLKPDIYNNLYAVLEYFVFVAYLVVFPITSLSISRKESASGAIKSMFQ